MVRAPFAGIVSARRVEPGESVAPGQPLMSVYAPGALRIEVQVPQSDAVAIRAANKARGCCSPTAVRVDAAEVTVFPAADPATHSVSVRVVLPEVENAPQPGVTAKVRFPDRRRRSVAAAFRSARSCSAAKSAASTWSQATGLSLRQVRLGQRLGDQVEVLAGLTSRRDDRRRSRCRAAGAGRAAQGERCRR